VPLAETIDEFEELAPRVEQGLDEEISDLTPTFRAMPSGFASSGGGSTVALTLQPVPGTRPACDWRVHIAM